MSIKISVKDGEGTDLEACVKTTPSGPSAMCTTIAGVEEGVKLTVIKSGGGGQKVGQLSKDGDLTTFNASEDGTLGSPVIFRFDPLTDNAFVITDLVIMGEDSSIKINNWFGKNSPLTNGCLLEVKSDNEISTLGTFQKTSHLALFASIAGFDLLTEAGGDLAKSIRQFDPALLIRRQNYYGPGNDDYITWTIQDSQTGVDDIRIEVRGFITDEDT